MKNRQKKPGQKSAKLQQYSVEKQAELLPFLLEVMDSRSRNSVKSMLTRGQILVDDRVETAHNFLLNPGQTVTVSTQRVADTSSLNGLTILHEDDDLIVIDKVSGLLSMASPKEKNVTAYRQLMDHVRRSHPKNRIYIVHRLDRDTSGVMMFAKNERAKQKLQESWKDMVKERTYVALVEGQVKKTEGTIASWLKETRTLKMYSSPKPNGGQYSVTQYKVLQSNKHFSLLELQLKTGRKNQIRVHMESIGHPIVGDKKYGSNVNEIGRLGLHARVLAFTHPTTGNTMRFETELPKSFLSKSK